MRKLQMFWSGGRLEPNFYDFVKQFNKDCLCVFAVLERMSALQENNGRAGSPLGA